MTDENLNKDELEFYATKQYLSKIAEKYKLRWYNDVLLEDSWDYLGEIKWLWKSINIQNELLKDLVYDMWQSLKKIGKIKFINPRAKKSLIENSLQIYSQFVIFTENIIRNEWRIIDTIDKFRRIEQEIDIKNRALTRYGFDKEFKDMLEWIVNKKYRDLTTIIFDLNNLKGINENFWHQTWAESIYKFWTILREELKNSWFKFLLSNYFWWDEWFLCLIDVSKAESEAFVKRFFLTLSNNIYKIRDHDLKLWACAWIAYYRPWKTTQEFLTQKKLIAVADTLLLQAKIRKTKNKTGNAYKIINITSMVPEELNKITKKIQTIPRKLHKSTLNKKKLVELFKMRKKQNESIMIARTLWVKKILRYNIDLINEIIWNKIIESISNVLIDTKKQTHQKVKKINKKLSNMIIWELEKISDSIKLNTEQRAAFVDKLLSSDEFQKFSDNEIESIYQNSTFEL